jgi:hypothetical protein
MMSEFDMSCKQGTEKKGGGGVMTFSDEAGVGS